MVKRVRAYLQGGLGNQCFIYATAKALALETNASLQFNVDRFEDDSIFHRKLELTWFKCSLDCCRKHLRIERVLANLWHRRLLCLSTKLNPNFICEGAAWIYQDLPRDWKGTLSLDGVWQCERYFDGHRGELYEDFALKDSAWMKADSVATQIQSTSDSVFLHVRSYTDIPGREDYSGALKVSYYEHALKLLAEEVKGPKTVFIFSDDINWAVGRLERLIRDLGYQFVVPQANPLAPVPPQVRDFMLMRLCQHGILANSSFSWWASWLGEEACRRQGRQTVRIRPRTKCMGTTYWPDRWLIAEL